MTARVVWRYARAQGRDDEPSLCLPRLDDGLAHARSGGDHQGLARGGVVLERGHFAHRDGVVLVGDGHEILREPAVLLLLREFYELRVLVPFRDFLRIGQHASRRGRTRVDEMI